MGAQRIPRRAWDFIDFVDFSAITSTRFAFNCQAQLTSNVYTRKINGVIVNTLVLAISSFTRWHALIGWARARWAIIWSSDGRLGSGLAKGRRVASNNGNT